MLYRMINPFHAMDAYTRFFSMSRLATDAFTRSAYTVQCTLYSTCVSRAIDECTNYHNSVQISRTAKVETPLERS